MYVSLVNIPLQCNVPFGTLTSLTTHFRGVAAMYEKIVILWSLSVLMVNLMKGDNCTILYWLKQFSYSISCMYKTVLWDKSNHLFIKECYNQNTKISKCDSFTMYDRRFDFSSQTQSFMNTISNFITGLLLPAAFPKLSGEPEWSGTFLETSSCVHVCTTSWCWIMSCVHYGQ